jgi:signal transduction histidine kinase
MHFERLLSDLSRTFISLPDDEIDANVERALSRIGTFLGIDRIAVYGLSPERTRLTVSHAWTVPGVMPPPESIRPAELPYWASKVLGGEVAVVSSTDELPQAAAAEKEFLGRWGAVSAASIPLIVGGEITGAISFVTLRREVSWTDDLVRQLRVISDIFSNAFKRKQGMAALRAAHAMADAIRSSFSRRLIEAQEEERTAVGRELHDDINQRVGLAILNLESLKSNVDIGDDARREIAGVVGQLGELSGDIQALSRRLHSSRLDQMGLKAAAESFCREVAAKHKLDVQFHADGIPQEMQSEIALCLFRVLQEAVQNSTKHSGATQLEVRLAGGPEEIRLMVRDSGAGFDLQDGARGDGIGLANMRERLRLVRGDLWIESAPGRGTVMHARVPLVARGNAAGTV